MISESCLVDRAMPFNVQAEEKLRGLHRPSTIKPDLVAIDQDCSLYVEESGNPDGIPVVFVHGGPGATFQTKDHQWFDPEKYRIILYQQRGTHNCIPSAENPDVDASIFKDVGIATLAKDMEKLRELLNITQWLVFGGSWGSTLGLYYAQEYPQACSGLVIRGIFIGSEQELEDFFTFDKIDEKVKGWNRASLQRLYDYAQARNIISTPKTICADYRKLIVEDNDLVACRLWRAFEVYMEDIYDQNKLNRILADDLNTTPDERLTGVWETQLFDHLVKHINLLEPSRIANLASIPIKIVQGEKDPICTPDVAQGLVNLLEKNHCDVNFSLIKEGEHSPHKHPGMMNALVRATDQFALNKKFTES